MKSIIGLGNPGEQYYQTRHSVGHLIVDMLEEVEGFVLVKSDVYMNRSGMYVHDYVAQHSVDLSDLVVVHDDWAFPIGEFRLQFGRGANHHRGVLDIIQRLGSKDFWRLRIGIGPLPSGVEGTDFVLSRLSNSELQRVAEIIPKIKEQLSSLAQPQ